MAACAPIVVPDVGDDLRDTIGRIVLDYRECADRHARLARTVK